MLWSSRAGAREARISRRTLIGGAAAASGAAAVPTQATAAGGNLGNAGPLRADVVVVGLSGLTAARKVGGQWIGPTQDHLAALARELSIRTFKTYNKGNYLFYESGRLTPYTPSGPFGAVPPDYVADAQIAPVLAELDAMAMPLDEPGERAVREVLAAL